VAVLAATERNLVVLTRQFRYALGAESVEVVSGGIDGDEMPEVAAQRELREEIGGESRHWIPLGVVHLDTSIVHCPVSLFIARGCTFTNTDLDDTEDISSLRLPLEEAVRLVMDGRITHAASCVLILKAQHILSP
jgi:ADP-ribose pyrophosphatase